MEMEGGRVVIGEMIKDYRVLLLYCFSYAVFYDDSNSLLRIEGDK